MDFTVLASGSSGNVSLLRVAGFGVLVDLGLGPRQLASRLRTVGSSWHEVKAAVLSHVHSDHWKEKTLRFLKHNQIPLYCHAGHEADLDRLSTGFADLRKYRLLHLYKDHDEITLATGLRFLALPLSHDSGPTCGFRLDGPDGAVGYATDLGTWQSSLAEALANVDILALEFNHDVAMEKSSGRDPQLIARVLGDAGHLSNEQAAALVREVLLRSQPNRMRHLVQLHMSRQCNRPTLARAVAERVLRDVSPALTIHTAEQDQPGPMLRIEPADVPVVVPCRQGSLPGWND